MLFNIPEAHPEHVGEQILLLRTRQQLTQTELARRTGLNILTIQRIENGKTPTPKPETLNLIFSQLGINIRVSAGYIVQEASHDR